jgi:hypothetical protein
MLVKPASTHELGEPDCEGGIWAPEHCDQPPTLKLSGSLWFTVVHPPVERINERLSKLSSITCAAAVPAPANITIDIAAANNIFEDLTKKTTGEEGGNQDIRLSTPRTKLLFPNGSAILEIP